MDARVYFLLVASILFVGCIQAGSLSIPADESGINLFDIKSAVVKNTGESPSSAEMGVPLKNLPKSYIRSAEHGTYTEAFSLKGLPSTIIYWSVSKDPYGEEYNEIDSDDEMIISVNSQNITVAMSSAGSRYIVATHVGLYTFTAWTESAKEIDSAKVYGDHEDIVMAVFTAGIENALNFDLESFEN